MEERDAEIVSFAKMYKLTGFEQGPFSVDQSRGLLEAMRQAIASLKEKIAQIKAGYGKQDKQLDEVLDKVKEEHNTCKERISQANKQLVSGEKRHKKGEKIRTQKFHFCVRIFSPFLCLFSPHFQ